MKSLHTRTRAFSRSKNKSAVKASAYRSGQKLHRDEDGRTVDYGRKQGVAHSEIMLPATAPAEYGDRQTLWNAVERAEKRKDSNLAREFEVELPRELGRAEQVALLQDFSKANFTDRGMIADINLHDRGDGNPHAHIMLTTRNVTKDGFGLKNTSWDDYNGRKGLVKGWRKDYADRANQYLADKGIAPHEQYDPRKLTEQGEKRIPTIHEGKEVTHLERKGVKTKVRAKNEAIKTRNEMQLPQTLYNANKKEQPTVVQPGTVFDILTSEGMGTKEKLIEVANKAFEVTGKVIEGTTEKTFQTIAGEAGKPPVFERKNRELKNDFGLKRVQEIPDSQIKEPMSTREIKDQLRVLQGERKELQAMQQNLSEYEQKIRELRNQADRLSPVSIKQRETLEANIKSLEQSRAEATATLKNEYNLTPGKINGRLQDIRGQYSDYKSQYEQRKPPEKKPEGRTPGERSRERPKALTPERSPDRSR